MNESEVLNIHYSVEVLHPRTEESKEEHIVCLTKVMPVFKRKVLVLHIMYTCDSRYLCYDYCT